MQSLISFLACKFIFRFLYVELFGHIDSQMKGRLHFQHNFGHFSISPKMGGSEESNDGISK